MRMPADSESRMPSAAGHGEQHERTKWSMGSRGGAGCCGAHVVHGGTSQYGASQHRTVHHSAGDVGRCCCCQAKGKCWTAKWHPKASTCLTAAHAPNSGCRWNGWQCLHQRDVGEHAACHTVPAHPILDACRGPSAPHACRSTTKQAPTAASTKAAATVVQAQPRQECQHRREQRLTHGDADGCGDRVHQGEDGSPAGADARVNDRAADGKALEELQSSVKQVGRRGFVRDSAGGRARQVAGPGRRHAHCASARREIDERVLREGGMGWHAGRG